MFRYRLFDVEGDDIGEIHLACPVDEGDVFVAGLGQMLCVIAVPATDEGSPFEALLMVKPPPLDCLGDGIGRASAEPS